MKILLTHIFSLENKGLAAINSVTISQLRSLFPGVELFISTSDDIKEGERHFAGTKEISSFFFFAISAKKSGLLRILRSTYMLLALLIWCTAYRSLKVELDFILTEDLKRILKTYVESDLIIFAGGGYLNGKNKIRDDINLFLLLYGIVVLLILGKKIILYAQSIGPFGDKFQKLIGKFVLNRAHVIFAREQKTVNFLKEIGISKPQVIKTVDVAFLFQSDKKKEMLKYLESLGVDTKKRMVGITAQKKFDHTPQEKFEMEFAKFADYLISEMDMQVIIIPQVVDPLHNEDDTLINERIKNKMQNTHGVWIIRDILDHHETKGIYENLDLLVGTRTHACIFALTGGVPVIAIEYVHKTSGIMNDLGLGEWVIKIEEVTSDKLIKIFTKFIEQKKHYLE